MTPPTAGPRLFVPAEMVVVRWGGAVAGLCPVGPAGVARWPAASWGEGPPPARDPTVVPPGRLGIRPPESTAAPAHVLQRGDRSKLRGAGLLAYSGVRRYRGGMAQPVVLRRSQTWNGLAAGAPVFIAGTGMRGASWTFRAHVRNEATGAEWVEVVGGRSGDRKIRSFSPDRVFAVSKAPRRHNLSLVDAPQLPLW